MKEKFGCENYIRDPRFSKNEIELLFALRTRTVNDIKRNFPNQFNNSIACDLCQTQVDCQEHLLRCVKLTNIVKVPEDIKYSDIFGNTEKQIKIVKIFKQLLRTREILKNR